MTSRRKLLVGVPVAVAAVLGGYALDRTRSVIDVRRFGAKGDGITDDSEAIQAAAAALRSNTTLFFPRGTYRFAQRHPRGSAAIAMTDVSQVTLEFEPGAELYMDNLDPTTGTGTSHGLLIEAPAWGISLRNVTIRWAQGAKRSFGDGIRVAGRPARHAVVSGIALSNCVVRGSPQAGVIMMGVSDIDIEGLESADSQADGLHFNACRRATINDYRAINTGDDGLALVTYYSPEFAFDEAAHTFSFPSLNDWSNAGFVIRDVHITGGQANGVRIAGTNQVTFEGLTAVDIGSGAAVMVDSAEPGTDVGWFYEASHDVRIDDLKALNCHTGIHLLARPGALGHRRDRQFTDFDMHVGDARFEDCHNWSVRAESLSEDKVSGFRLDRCHIAATSTTGGNGGMGFGNAERVLLGNVAIRHAEPVAVFRAENVDLLIVDQLDVAIDQAEQPQDIWKAMVVLDESHGVVNGVELG